MKQVLVLGPGCYRCEKLYNDVKAVIEENSIDAELTKVTDISAIAGFGVMQTPAIVVDDELKAAGQLLTKDQIKALLD